MCLQKLLLIVLFIYLVPDYNKIESEWAPKAGRLGFGTSVHVALHLAQYYHAERRIASI